MMFRWRASSVQMQRVGPTREIAACHCTKSDMMELVRPLVTLLGTFLNWTRGVARRLGSLRATRRADVGLRLSAKCPKCGEPDFRTSDRQRTRPEVYGSNTFRLKWLCLTCGHRTVEIVEDPN